MDSYESQSSLQNFKPLHQQQNCYKYDISVLKHLPKPLSILTKPTYQYISSKCLYQIPLRKVQQSLISCGTLKATNRKLIGIEETQYQHKKMKEKIYRIYRNQQFRQNRQTLWDLYSNLIPYYSRFINNNRKNFANVLMGINGIKVGQQKKGKPAQLPRLITPSIQNQSGSIKFESHFQSGNLLYVYKKNSEIIQTYDLILQNDINTRGHNQWFFFKMQNIYRNQKIKINIVNFIKSDSLFNYGLKILVFSENRNRKTGKGWMRQGQKVTYDQTNIKRQNKQTNHYSLSFEYTFSEENDTVYMCPSYPYTYTNLNCYLQKIFKPKQHFNFLTIKKIGETLGGNIVNVVSVSTGNLDIQDKDSKIVWILARQHPAQTTSSYMVEGIINYLLQLITKQGSNRQSWLDKYVFKIIPMVNADGVIHGNTRSQLSGVDPNRMWAKPYRKYSPVINYIKKAILQTKNNISMVLDLHSHSKKTGCFFYGNSVIHNPSLSKVYPSYVCENDQRFIFKNCKFRGGYETTLRKVLFNQLAMNPNIFTVQCSLYGYDKNHKMIEFTTNDYRQMGAKLIISFLQLEKVKFNQKIQQIILNKPQIIDWKDDGDSARSQSSLSDQQFEQVYPKKNRTNNYTYLIQKKRMISNQKNKIEQTCENRQKMLKMVRNSLKSTDSKLKKKRVSGQLISINQPKIHKSTNRDHINDDTIIPFDLSNQNGKLEKNQIQRNKRLIFVKNAIKSYVNQDKTLKSNKNIKNQLSARQIKSIGIQVNIQVPIIKQKSTQVLTRRKGNTLYIVGSSIQDQRNIVINKNQVAIQYITPQQNIIKKNAIRQSKSSKIPKVLSYICNNMIGTVKENLINGEQKKGNVQNSKSSTFKKPLLYKN